MAKKNSVIIVSGGMDSITLLYDWQDDIALGISFDYGSNHNAREIPLAAMHCKRLGIPHIVINLDFMPRNYAETWSCYKGGAHHCGKCGTCIERKEALQAAGIDDPTLYDA